MLLTEEQRVSQHIQRKEKRALYKLAKRYHYDKQGRPRGAEEVKKAVYYYALAAAAGSVESALQLAYIYRYGDVVTSKNAEQMLKYYGIADELGSVKAALALAEIYRYEEGVAKDSAKSEEYYAKAIERLRKADREGDVEAAFALAELYYYGRGVPEDMRLALHYYEKASDNRQALTAMAYIYISGAIEKDVEKAIYYYILAAVKGDHWAIREIHSLYQRGEIGESHWQEALQSYTNFAERMRSMRALLELEWIYKEVGDNEKALRYYRRALSATEKTGKAEKSLIASLHDTEDMFD